MTAIEAIDQIINLIPEPFFLLKHEPHAGDNLYSLHGALDKVDPEYTSGAWQAIMAALKDRGWTGTIVGFGQAHDHADVIKLLREAKCHVKSD